MNHLSCHDFPWLCELTMIVSTTCHPCLFLWIWLHHCGGGSHSQGDSQGKFQTSRQPSRQWINLPNWAWKIKHTNHQPTVSFCFSITMSHKNPEATCINSFTDKEPLTLTTNLTKLTATSFFAISIQRFWPSRDVRIKMPQLWPQYSSLETYTNQGSTRECFDLYAESFDCKTLSIVNPSLSKCPLNIFESKLSVCPTLGHRHVRGAEHVLPKQMLGAK